MKRNVVTGSMLVFALGGALGVHSAGAQPPAPAAPAGTVDLGALELKGISGRIVESIKLPQSEIKAPAGTKLWVGTLRGTLKTPGKVSLSAKAFQAIYGVTSEGPKPQEKVERIDAVAVRLGDDEWGATATKTYDTARDVTIEVAAPVNAGVRELFFLYDTAQGKGRAKSQLDKTDKRR